MFVWSIDDEVGHRLTRVASMWEYENLSVEEWFGVECPETLLCSLNVVRGNQGIVPFTIRLTPPSCCLVSIRIHTNF